MLHAGGSTGGGEKNYPGDTLELTVVDSVSGKPIPGATFNGTVTGFYGGVAKPRLPSVGTANAEGVITLNSDFQESVFSGEIAAPGYEPEPYEYGFTGAASSYQSVVPVVQSAKTGLTPKSGGTTGPTGGPTQTPSNNLELYLIVGLVAVGLIVAVVVVAGGAK